MSVYFFNEDYDYTLKHKTKLKLWVKGIIEGYKKKIGTINFIFTSNRKILEINQQFLNHDYFTDIITFNYNRNIILSGDIYISLDTVSSNSDLYSVTFENELYRVMAHGILHLIGFNDKSDVEKKQMHNAENRCLEDLHSKFNIK